MSTFNAQLFAQAVCDDILDVDSRGIPGQPMNPIALALVGEGQPVGYEAEPRVFWYDRILQSCIHSSEVQLIRRVVGGIIIADPPEAICWLRVLEGIFTARRVTDLINAATAGSSPAFPFGVVLGLLQAQVWLDKGGDTKESPFTTHLPNVIGNIIVSHADFILRDEVYGSSRPPNEIYGKPLSQAAKAWALRTYDSCEKGRVSQRMAQAYQLVRWVGEYCKSRPDETLTKFGAKILDEVNYALFGKFSTQERSQAMALMLDSLMPKPQQV